MPSRGPVVMCEESEAAGETHMLYHNPWRVVKTKTVSKVGPRRQSQVMNFGFCLMDNGRYDRISSKSYKVLA